MEALILTGDWGGQGGRLQLVSTPYELEQAKAPGAMRLVGKTATIDGRTKDPAETVSWLATQARALLASVGQTRLDAVSLAIAGENDGRIVVKAPNDPALNGCHLAEMIEGALNVSCGFGNDVTQSTYGAWLMAGCPMGVKAGMTLSSGLGFRFIMNGVIVSERAEFGHMICNPGAPTELCGCGHFGHFESELGGDCLTARVENLTVYRDYLEQCRRNETVPIHPLTYLDREADAGRGWAIKTYNRYAMVLAQFFYNAFSTMPEVERLWLKGTIAQRRWAYLYPPLTRIMPSLGFLDLSHVQYDLVPGPKFPDAVKNEDAFRGAAYSALLQGLLTR